MKKLIMVPGFVLLAFAIKAQPQQPPKPPSMEERLKKTNELIQQDVQPTASQKTAIAQAYKQFFTAADQLRKDNPPPPPPPPDPKVKEAMDKLVKERDEQVKKVLTDAQYQKYKETAKKLQPPPPGEKGKHGPPPQL
jgi:hypothetical protein